MNPSESVPKWPRISLVTAVYNGERFLEATIRSVLSQGYPNLEYIVVDAESSDGTAGIIRKYEQHIASCINQPNKGVYAALNTGFARSTGEILGWLNSSDLLHTHGLFVVGSVFKAFPDVQWITGRPTLFQEEGWPAIPLELPHWTRYRFLAGANRHIQQESTYWRRGLWETCGGELSTAYRAEGDFELWTRFFRHARLHTVDALIAGWRYHSDSLSRRNIERYYAICDEIIESELKCMSDAAAVKTFRSMSRAFKRIPIIRGIWRRVVLKSLYQLPGPDWPPVITYGPGGWTMG